MESAESAPSAKAQKKPRVQWTEKATWALIKSWEDNLDALRGQKHNGVVYQRIAESVSDAGIPRTRAQVHAKIDNLTQTFRYDGHLLLFELCVVARVPLDLQNPTCVDTWYIEERGKPR